MNTEISPSHACAAPPGARRRGVFRILPSGFRVVEFPSGDKARPSIGETRRLIDGDEVEVSGSKKDGYTVTLVARRRDLVVGTVYKNKEGKLRLRLDPRLGLASPAVHVRSVKPGDAGVFTLDAERGYDRCVRLVAGPWPELSLDHLRTAALVVAVGVPPQRAAALPSDLCDLGYLRLSHALGLVRPPKVPQPRKETVNRTDFYDEPTVTIDGPDTRDIDDAVAAVALPSGGWRVRVHIADVAAEVPQGSELDLWALAASTSVYLPGKVVPMLPSGLSEDRCSLVEAERRRVLTVTFTVAPDGTVSDVALERGRIRSDARLTYDAVDGFLAGDRAAVPAPVADTVAACAAAAAALGRSRAAADRLGDIIVPAQVSVALVDGQVTLRREDSATPAHKLIEELMVAANEAVGTWLASHAAPALYRRQDDPAAMPLLAELTALAALSGPSAPGVDASEDGDDASEDVVGAADDVFAVPCDPAARLGAERIAELLDAAPAELRPVGVQRVAQALGRAYYAPGPGGHFHLGKTHYLHFTSPIRRYADLIVHRTVLAVIDGEPLPYSPEELAALGRWVTARAAQADRAEAMLERSLWAALFASRAAAGNPVVATATVSSCQRRAVSARLVRFSVPVEVPAPSPDGWVTARGSLEAVDGSTVLRVGEPVRLAVTAADVLTGRCSAAVAAP